MRPYLVQVRTFDEDFMRIGMLVDYVSMPTGDVAAVIMWPDRSITTEALKNVSLYRMNSDMPVHFFDDDWPDEVPLGRVPYSGRAS